MAVQRGNTFNNLAGPLESSPLKAATYEAQHCPDFRRYQNEAGERLAMLAKAANNTRKGFSLPAVDYELHAIALRTVRPTVSSEEYAGEESHRIAEGLRSVADRESPNAVDWEVINRQHLNPIVIDERGQVVLGNDHHGAAAVNGDNYILALTPVGPGFGKIRNLREAYSALSSGQGSSLIK